MRSFLSKALNNVSIVPCWCLRSVCHPRPSVIGRGRSHLLPFIPSTCLTTTPRYCYCQKISPLPTCRYIHPFIRSRRGCFCKCSCRVNQSPIYLGPLSGGAPAGCSHHSRSSFLIARAKVPQSSSLPASVCDAVCLLPVVEVDSTYYSRSRGCVSIASHHGPVA